MYKKIWPFNVHLYCRPDDTSSGPEIEVLGVSLPTLVCPGISQTRFEFSFEEAAERLQKLERLSFEMDGSFVWAGRLSDDVLSDAGLHDAAWQIYGMLYDYGGRLQRIELQGTCPHEKWRELQSIFDTESRPQVAHLLAQGCFVDAGSLSRMWENSKGPL